MSHPVGKAARGGFFWADVLRFVAATLVVMEHARDLLFLTFNEAPSALSAWKLFYFGTGFGSEAVIVFFVLSGFWITSAVSRRIDAPGFWRTYLIDRLSRLMIVVVPVLLLGALLDLTSIYVLASQYTSGTSGALTVPHPVIDSLGAGPLLGNLLFLQRLVFPTYGSNGPLWSLAFEFWYYIWFPSLLLLFTRRKISPGLLALGLGVVSLEFVEGFGVWLMGSGLFYLDRRAVCAGGADWTGAKAWGTIGGSAVLLLAVLAASRLALPIVGSTLMLGAAFALFFWVLLRVNPRPLGLAKPFARYGAGSSFSLYAFHFPFLLALASIMPVGIRTAPSAMRLAEWAAIVLAAIAVGWLLSLITEANTGALRDWLRDRVPGAPAVAKPG